MSLFGNFGQPASQPSGFGQPASQPSGFGQPASQPSGFGQPASQPSGFGQPVSQPSGFGQPVSQPSGFGQPASQPSLFSQPQSAPSLFGVAPQVPGQPQSTSLFSTTASAPAGAPATSLFGIPAASSSLSIPQFQPITLLQQQQQLLQQQQQQQQQQVAQPPKTVDIPGHTKISQLPEKFRTDLFAVERHLRDERSKFTSLMAKRYECDEKTEDNMNRTEALIRTVVKLRAEIDAMQTNANSLRTAVAQERSSAEPIVIAFDNLTKSTGNAAFIDSNGLRYAAMDGRLQRAAHVPEEYFRRVVDDLESRAHTYKSEIDQIAQFLRAQGVPLGTPSTVSGKPRAPSRMHGALLLDNISQRYSTLGICSGQGNGAADVQVETSGRTIEEIIRRQYEYFMVVASHVANVKEELRNASAVFLQMLSAKDGDVLNPFEQADLREKADQDRLRIMAERNATEDNMGFAGNAYAHVATGMTLPAVHVAGTGNVTLTTGALTGAKDSGANGVAASAGFSVAVNGGGTSDGIGISGSRRMSTGRRKRM